MTRTLAAGALGLALFAAAPEPAGIGRIAAGGTRSIFQAPDGTLWVWGDGDPITTPLKTPLLGFAAGQRRLSLLSPDGTVWSVDSADSVSDAQAVAETASIRTRVSGLTGVAAIAAAGDHTLAWKIDGSVWRWTPGGAPVRVAGPPPVLGVAAGDRREVAFAFDGPVWSSPAQDAPRRVTGLPGVAAIAAGERESLAVKSDG